MTGEAAMTRAQIRDRASAIAAEIGAGVVLDAPLGPLVSMRVGGRAAALVQPRDPAMLALAVRRLHAEGVPCLLLGGGSNLLIADADLDHAVVQVAAASTTAAWNGCTVRAPGGMPLALIVSEAIRRGCTGLEWAAGLPGTVGGAVAGNAGAFGGEIASSVREVAVMSPRGDVRVHAPADGDFAYRRSFLRPGDLVLEVTLELSAEDPAVVRERTADVNRRRAGSQPKGGHSSGCIFRNPPGDAAGRLVDVAGLKGQRVGGAFVSPAHGNFIINDGTATATDILELIRLVRSEVEQRTGVKLELEVQIWPPGAEGETP